MTNSFELALRVSVGIVVALAFVWTTLIIALVFLRPKGGLLREAMRILPDTIRLLRRLATDRSIGVGVRVRLWLLFVYLAVPIDLIQTLCQSSGTLMTQSSLLPSSVLWSGELDLTPFVGIGPARPMDSQACGDSRDSMARLSENDLPPLANEGC